MGGRILSIICVSAAASFLFLASGCAQLPFGHRPESDGVSPADAAAAAPIAGASVAEIPGALGSLSQITTMPGSGADVSADSHKVMSPVALNEPAVSGQGGAVVPVRATVPAPTIPLGASGVVNAEMRKFIFRSPAERVRYEKAAARFPDFCHDWQRMLRDRENNNLEHLTWQTLDGARTSTYTGYGQVEKCETKESVEGVPIGKISYLETVYFLSGKSTDEARHAPPKVIHQTHTLEIFSWEKDKWFY
jgi:hypothetical protein